MERTVPVGVRGLSVFYVVAAVPCAWCSYWWFADLGRGILAAACLILIAAAVGSTVYGLLRVRRWGWWLAAVLHGLLVGVGPVAYLVLVATMIPELSRPAGHMELITPTQFLVLMAIVALLYTALATLPLAYLMRTRIRNLYLK